MADPVANSLAIITATINTIKYIHRAVEAVKDAPDHIKHLDSTCKLVDLHMHKIHGMLERKRMQPEQTQYQAPYYEAIKDVLECLKGDLSTIQANIPEDFESRGFTGRWLRSRAMKALKLNFNINDKVLARVDRSINILALTTTNLWEYEQALPPQYNRTFQDGLRTLMQQLGSSELSFQDGFALISAPEDAGRLTYLEELRTHAFGIANRLAMRSLGSTSSINRPREYVPLLELGFRFEEAQKMADHAEEQQFPDAAAEFQAQALEIRTQIVEVENGEPDDFLQRIKLESRYITILTSCMSRENRDKGKRRLSELTREIKNMTSSSGYDKATLATAREVVGKVYYQIHDWNAAIQLLRDALFESDFIRNKNEEEIRRLSKLICRAYEASTNIVDLRAFRRSINHLVGFDPASDPDSFEAALEWCRKNGFPIDDTNTSPSLVGLRDDNGNYHIHKAVQDPDIDPGILRQLASDREALDARGKDEMTPLFIAIEQSQVKAVTVLLSEGASMDIRKPYRDMYDTVLHSCQNPAIMNLLLSRLSMRRSSIVSSELPQSYTSTASMPIHIDSKNLLGCTALHEACDRNDYECAKILLSHGADPNALNNSDETPLIAVSYNKSSKADTRRILEELIKYGAHADHQDRHGQHVREGLRHRGFKEPEIKKLLTVNYGAEIAAGRTSGSTMSSSPKLPTIDLHEGLGWPGDVRQANQFT